MTTPAPRRSSLGLLLRRTKSGELKGRKQPAKSPEAAVPKSPPRLPVLYNGAPAPTLQSLDDAFAMPDDAPRPSVEPSRSVASVPPPVPGLWADPYARTESMTHRGRYSYASSAVSTIQNPRRVRRRKDPTPFNILIVGTRGAGKTSFLDFLKTALALPAKKRPRDDDYLPRAAPSGSFIPHYLEAEMDGERIGLTLWDSEGLEKNVVDLQLREMATFVESKFEETFAEEMKVIRSPGVQDTHIHAVFLVLDPSRLDRNMAAARAAKARPAALDDDLDLQVLRILQGKTTVIPVVSKADTITTKHMAVLKRSVADALARAGLDPLEALGFEDAGRIDEEDEEQDPRPGDGPDPLLPIQGRDAGAPAPDDPPLVPMSIISPDIYEPGVVGRQFPWGFADPNNEDHCDFVRLKDAVFSDWRAELREASREQWYEGWRTSRLKRHRERVR